MTVEVDLSNLHHMTNSRLVPTSDVARDLNVSRQTVAHWIKTGKLRAIKTPGGSYRIPREDVDAILRGEQPAAAS